MSKTVDIENKKIPQSTLWTNKFCDQLKLHIKRIPIVRNLKEKKTNYVLLLAHPLRMKSPSM